MKKDIAFSVGGNIDDKVVEKLRAAGIFELLAKASNQNREDSLPIGENQWSRINNDCKIEDSPELVDDENDGEDLPV